MTLHTCPPPNLDDWLKEDPSVVRNYGHLLLEQKKAKDDGLLAKLKPYFESAHLDARTVFHEFIGIDLHPDTAVGPADISYPSSLHEQFVNRSPNKNNLSVWVITHAVLRSSSYSTRKTSDLLDPFNS